MPPNTSGSLDRPRMVRLVRRLTAGAAIAATAATVALTVVVASTQADAHIQATDEAGPEALSVAPDDVSDDGVPSTSPTPAPSQLSTAPAPTRALGGSHAGSGGS
jgi:hypothetical protein